jgi:putative Mg2+ transporter-C (MgtC) family protein
MLSNIFVTQLWALGKVGISMLLGAVIGIEREVADKPAGLRTHMLVAGSATLLVLLGDKVVEQFSNLMGTEFISSDPIRIIAAVITGISFLGAGTIIRNAANQDVEGLTTAASLLIASAVGIGVALSEWVLAGGTTLLILVTLRIISFIRWRLFASHRDDV